MALRGQIAREREQQGRYDEGGRTALLSGHTWDGNVVSSNPSEPAATTGRAERLNQGCFCVTLDRERLAAALDEEVGEVGFAAHLAAFHQTLFSNVPIFVPADAMADMERVVDAIECAANAPEYVAAVLAHAPAIAQADFGPLGAFMGYDFHLTPDGPKLIEVNTNAGGAFLNAFLARAQRACCAEILPSKAAQEAVFDAKVAAMFVEEWRRQGRAGAPGRIAIVDDAPEQQHLYAEFELARALLIGQGLDAVIVDPMDFELRDDRLYVGDLQIDLVYNRLVDFAFEEPRHAVLRAAYLGGEVVVTPNPHIHATLADKRNLMELADAERLESWGLAPAQIESLQNALLLTTVVSADNADDLWRDRNALFFKPAGGHGSKAAYRGDKVTRKVWEQITAGGYVAQAFAAPGRRRLSDAGEPIELKVDVRLYTYAGDLLLAAARLYQGQTTNMRTPGGGFAPVLMVAAGIAV
jgi:hypothetical protein